MFISEWNLDTITNGRDVFTTTEWTLALVEGCTRDGSFQLFAIAADGREPSVMASASRFTGDELRFHPITKALIGTGARDSKTEPSAVAAFFQQTAPTTVASIASLLAAGFVPRSTSAA